MGCQVSQSGASPELVPVESTLLAAGGSSQHILYLKVVKATLKRSFDQFGKMDPFCVVSMAESDGASYEVATTKTDWGGHMTPSWDHICRGVLYRGSKGGDKLTFQVLEKNFGDFKAPTFCGEATIAAHELMKDGTKVGEWTKEHVLVLKKKDEETGTLTIKAGLNIPDAAGPGQTVSAVDSRIFDTPVKKPLNGAGGGSEHYNLRLKRPERGTPADYWFGKDAGSAAAEIPFYEKCLALAKESNPPEGSAKPILEHFLDYAGIVEVPIEGQAVGARPKPMLVLQNLLADYKQGRMLDLKLGENSSDSTFASKRSGFAAIKQTIMDGLSFTASEGFRLESFAGQPESLTSRNPLIHSLVEGNPNMREKAIRVMLQRLTGADIFMYYADMHKLQASSSSMAPAEFSEIVLGETVVKLCKYALALRQVTSPQDFAHGSVGLSFDSEKLPSRSTSEATIRQGVRMKAFSWAKSSISNLEEHRKTDAATRKERTANWRQYKGGLDRLAWEGARAYQNQFGNAGEWEDVIATVIDFDGNSSDDFMGQLRIPLKECENKTEFLYDKSWKQITNKGQEPTLTFSVKWRSYGRSSRLRGAWAITIVSGANLPKLDKLLGSSDPYVRITATASNERGGLVFVQQSTVVERELNPVWNETLELPLAKSNGLSTLAGLLDSVSPGLGSRMRFPDVLPPAWGTADSEEKQALKRWQDHLTAPKAPHAPAPAPLSPGNSNKNNNRGNSRAESPEIELEEKPAPETGCGCSCRP